MPNERDRGCATEPGQHAEAKTEASPIALIERAKEIDPSAWRGDGSGDGHKRRMAAIRKARQEQATQPPATTMDN
jgi:hypothetical protein